MDKDAVESAKGRLNEMPRIYHIKKIADECKIVKTFFFEGNEDYLPGQFYMVWLPGVDAKPFTLSYHKKSQFAITIRKYGSFTRKLLECRVGDKIGFLGPYGKPFSIRKNTCIVGGGVGIACVATLVDAAKNPLVIIGGKDKKNLIFEKRYKKAVICTDDGSYGKKGFVTEALKEVLEDKKSRIKMVQACGPEIMMKKVFDLCEKHKIECEVSLERYMGCGFGICGKCVCGNKLVCIDGPVFNSNELRTLSEFGRYRREGTGKKVEI